MEDIFNSRRDGILRGRHSPDDVPDILRVDNCSEVDVAGNFYQQDGKSYYYCCDLENEDALECDEIFGFFPFLIFGIIPILFGFWFVVVHSIVGFFLLLGLCNCVEDLL